MSESVQRRQISWTEVHELFLDISDHFGYTAERYEDELADLITIWGEQGYVELYESIEDRQYARAKDSSLVYGASPFYIGLFHVRLVRGDNDPLVVLVFEDRENGQGGIDKIASLRFMLDHDEMFGTRSQKRDSDFMRQLRARVDRFVQQGNN
ncbi:MAG: hypothetical protein ACRC0U_02925 [Vibrio sp.]